MCLNWCRAVSLTLISSLFSLKQEARVFSYAFQFSRRVFSELPVGISDKSYPDVKIFVLCRMTIVPKLCQRVLHSCLG